MPGGFRCVFIMAVVIASLHLRDVAAQECPSAQMAPQGFVVERSQQTVEVFFVGDGVVRTVYRSSRGETWLETTEFEGLFELERIDRGKRSTFRPKTDLAKLFPLRAGQEISAEFEFANAAGQVKTGRVSLAVKGSDTLFIGACKYKVFAMDRSVMWGEEALRFLRTDYYAPDLKLIIAKAFKERNGTITMNKYDRISAMKR